jgi:tRNA dimethylallyltransferase
VQLGITVPLDELDERIDARVGEMFGSGLVAEVRLLESRGLRSGRTASRALGYAQVLRHLDEEISEGQARGETAQATRRFARRQQSWFRRDPRIEWVPAAEIIERGLALIRRTIDQ